MSRNPLPPLGRSAGLLLVAALCTACASTPARSPFDGSAPRDAVEQSIRVEVQNLNFNDATIFAMRSSQRIRVGRVTGKTSQTFRINWNVAQSIWFQVDVVGGRSCRTGEVIVEADSRVFVTIPSDMGYGACRATRT